MRLDRDFVQLIVVIEEEDYWNVDSPRRWHAFLHVVAVSRSLVAVVAVEVDDAADSIDGVG